MKTENSIELCKAVANSTGGACLLMFSKGKDAIASWLQLRRFFDRIVPIWFYLHPSMKFELDAIKYYEDFFETKIVRMPHPIVYRWINNLTFQPNRNRDLPEELQLPNFTYLDAMAAVIEDYELPIATQAALGVRSCDSIVRRISINKLGAWNKKKSQFFPVYDWNVARIREEFQACGVKLPIDYKWFGRSFDGIDRRFTEPLKKYAPDDFAKLVELYPLLEADIKRYEYAGIK